MLQSTSREIDSLFHQISTCLSSSSRPPTTTTTSPYDTLSSLATELNVVTPPVQLTSIQLNQLHQLIRSLIQRLTIPLVCSIPTQDLNETQQTEINQFKLDSLPSLHLALALLSLVVRLNIPVTLEISVQRFLIFAQFTQSNAITESFLTPLMASTALQIIPLLLTPSSKTRSALLHHLLSKSFPPLFKPHPKVNPDTGRALSRPMGGDRGMSDWYEESEELETWRKAMGMSNVIYTVVLSLEKQEIEEWWHLILPPLLTFLDDFDARNKLTGTYILSTLLAKVDANLLRRTGVGLIFTQSLASSFSNLDSPHSPPLLLAAHSTSLQLVNLLHPLPSESRFNALSTLFTDGVIHLWEFKSGNYRLEMTVLQLLPDLFNAIQEGVIRFLQILVPHLTHLLGSTTTLSMKTIDLLNQCVECLMILIRVMKDKSRIQRWHEMIVLSAAQCWINCREEVMEEEMKQRANELERRVREMVGELGQNQVPRQLIEYNPIFHDLVTVN